MTNRKYRILEYKGGFYPQEKKWYHLWWSYIDNIINCLHLEMDDESRCKDINQAKEVINRRIKSLNTKPIIHKYEVPKNVIIK